MEIAITHEDLAVSGVSNQIVFFTNNGTEYVLDQIIETNETMIAELSITNDFNKLAFGKLNQTVNIFTKVNSTY